MQSMNTATNILRLWITNYLETVIKRWSTLLSLLQVDLLYFNILMLSFEVKIQIMFQSASRSRTVRLLLTVTLIAFVWKKKIEINGILLKRTSRPSSVWSSAAQTSHQNHHSNGSQKVGLYRTELLLWDP